MAITLAVAESVAAAPTRLHDPPNCHDLGVKVMAGWEVCAATRRPRGR
jgi:hypothetical protein